MGCVERQVSSGAGLERALEDVKQRDVHPLASLLSLKRDDAVAKVLSPDYIAAAGMPATLAELREHRLVRYRYPGSEALQPWRFASLFDLAGGEPASICTSMEAVLSATLCGLGIAQMPDFLVDDALAAGRLVAMFDQETPSGTFSLLWHDAAHGSPKLRAFIDFCIEQLS